MEGNFKCVMEVTQIHRNGPMNVNTSLRLHTSENILMPNGLRQQSALFEVRFLRCHKMLRFLACRVLGSTEQAHEVVKSCKVTASRRRFPQLAGKNSYRRSLSDCPSERAT